MKIKVKLRRQRIDGKAGIIATRAEKNTLLTLDQAVVDARVSAGEGQGTAVEVVGAAGLLVEVVQHADAGTPTDYPTVLKTVAGSVEVTLDSAGILLENASNTLTLASSALTENMSIIEIDVCDSGTPKKMLLVGSAPYTP